MSNWSRLLDIEVIRHLLNAFYSVLTRFGYEPQQVQVSRRIPVQGDQVPSPSIIGTQTAWPSASFGQISHALTYNGQVVQPTGNQEVEENTVLYEKVKQYQEENAEMLTRFQDLKEEMKAKRITSFEALVEQDKKAAQLFIELARLTQSVTLEGNHIGIFGLTSTGKSTLLNVILGMNVAETGVGETTRQITPYPTSEFTLWDVPGRNDEVIYLSMEYISFFKGLARRLILIRSTVKENSSMMKLLDEFNLQYDIVVNKFDLVDENERQELKDQIQREIETLKLKKVNKIFYVSAKHPQMFPDWIEMINYLTN